MDQDPDDDLAWSLMDIMAATMFVFIILLVLYVYQFRANYENAPAVGQQVSDVIARRSQVLDMLSDALDRRGLPHHVNSQRAEISFSASAFAFASGRFEMNKQGQRNAARLADALAEVLSCFAAPVGNPPARCPVSVGGSLESLAVIGHTDNVPVHPGLIAASNLELSVRRAAHLVGLLEANKQLAALRNNDGNMLLIATGAGARRPVHRYRHPVADSRNRRITLRVALEAPWLTF